MLVFWMFLVALTYAVQANEMMPLDTVKQIDISEKWKSGSGGAIEHTRMVLEQIIDMEPKGSTRFGKNNENWRPTSPIMNLGNGWQSFVSQDAVSSWKPGSGITAYAMQEFSR